MHKHLLSLLLKIILCLSVIFLLVGCANKQVLVGKKCFIDKENNTTTITKSYIWKVEKNSDWQNVINKENCNK